LGNPYVTNFIRLVNDFYKEFHSTTYYADKLCITPHYLNQIVKAALGVNAKLYIQNRILLEAKRLLAYLSLSVNQISEMLYFYHSSYFIRFFRNQTSLTPLQYRNTLR